MKKRKYEHQSLGQIKTFSNLNKGLEIIWIPSFLNKPHHCNCDRSSNCETWLLQFLQWSFKYFLQWIILKMWNWPYIIMICWSYLTVQFMWWRCPSWRVGSLQNRAIILRASVSDFLFVFYEKSEKYILIVIQWNLYKADISVRRTVYRCSYGIFLSTDSHNSVSIRRALL